MQPVTQPPVPSPLARLAPWAWLLLPLACHAGFSWIGFNPTDDGWMQAVARRMLDGEFPHRDFIFVRPALSALLQVPLVWLGGDHVIWLSRLWGWLTLGGTTWLWSGFARRGGTPPGLRYPLYAAAFFLCAHFFPVMAWHSLDGMLLCTVAVWCAARGRLRTAFVCAGLAALCRQNFAFFTPVLLLAVAEPRKWRAVWWAALPPLAYLAATLMAGCLREFLAQAASPGGLFRYVAWENYLYHPLFHGLILVGALAALLLPRLAARHAGAGRVAAALACLVSAGFVALGLWNGPGHFQNAAYGLMGLVAGLALGEAVRNRRLLPVDRLPLVAGLGLAWVTAISIGWNSPALMSGVLLILIWRAVHLGLAPDPVPARTWSLAAALLAVGATGAAFRHARLEIPYRDAPAGKLSYAAGDALAGAAGLRTNVRTYAVLLDLKELLARCAADNQTWALLTDGSAIWIRSPQRNPLPCEWPQIIELGYNPRLVNRVIDALCRLPPGARIIVQRVMISHLGYTIERPGDDYTDFLVQNWVRANARKTGETPYFEIYAPPSAPPAAGRD